MTFAHLLNQFVERDGRHQRQFSQATIDRFGKAQKVPHNTISRWLRGEVKRPRNWRDILKLAQVMQLSHAEADQLIQVAGHPKLSELQQSADEEETAVLFAPWLTPKDKPPPFQVPPRRPQFVGRQAESNQIKKWLRSENPVFCIEGMGGVGKTTLAIHLAYELRPHFPDGVLWLRVAQAHPMAALQAIATAFDVDVSHYTDINSRSSKVRELLAYQKVLLLLDDVANDAALRPLMPPTGKCAVIITTRRHDLAVADDAHRLLLSPFTQEGEESLTLLEQILGKAHDNEELEIRHKIVDVLGHLPLALNIAAHNIRSRSELTPKHFLIELQTNKDRLGMLQRGDRNVRLTFELSYEQLSAAEQQLFKGIGIFPGDDFHPEAAAAITEMPSLAAAKGLQRLQQLSLVQATEKGRYQLHPLLREYSREMSDSSLLTQNLLTYTINFLHQHSENFHILDGELSNLLPTLQLAHTIDRPELLVQGTNLLFPFLLARGFFDQISALLIAAEQIARSSGDAKNLAQILHNHGRVALKKGEVEQAEVNYLEALTLLEQADDLAQRGDLLLKLGALAHRKGAYEEAQSYYEEALIQAEADQNTYQIAALRTNLGLLAAIKGNRETAVSLYKSALPLAEEIQDKSLRIIILQNMGDLYEQQGDFAQAKQHYEQGLKLAMSVGSPELKSQMMGNLGLVACALGNYAEAAAYFRRGYSLAVDSGLRLEMARQQANLGQVAGLRHTYEQANTHYEEALSIVRKLRFSEDIAIILNQWGAVWHQQLQMANAADAFQEALQISETANIYGEIAKAQFGLAKIAANRGDVTTARRYGTESQSRFASIDHQKASEVGWWLQELPPELGD